MKEGFVDQETDGRGGRRGTTPSVGIPVRDWFTWLGTGATPNEKLFGQALR